MAAKNGINSADIARMTGVSRATVSYIINNRTDQPIREETRRRVLDAIEQSGYRPNSTARALARGRTMNVALWVPVTNRSVSGHYIDQIGKLAKNDDYHIVVVEIAGETPESLSRAGMLATGTVDGILAVDARQLVEDLFERYQHLPPIVTMGPAFSTKTDYAGVDLAQGSWLAMQHVLGQGRHQIAFVAHELHHYPGDPRYDAYMAGIESIGAEPDILSLEQPRRSYARLAVLERFRHRDTPDALFCFNDDCAIGANRALSELGLRVPDDVAIAGSDGIDETEYSIPSVTTVAQPFADICDLAWGLLRRRMQQPDAPISGSVLPMQLIVRESTSMRQSLAGTRFI